MNRITRMLAMTGIGVFAAVSVGAGQAMATTGGAQAPAKVANDARKASPASRTDVIDVYSSLSSCRYAGRLGEALGDWDGYVCYRTFGGYALQVSFDSWGDFNSWDNSNWNGPWGIHGGGGGNWHDGRGRGDDHGNRGGGRGGNRGGNRGGQVCQVGVVPPVGGNITGRTC